MLAGGVLAAHERAEHRGDVHRDVLLPLAAVDAVPRREIERQKEELLKDIQDGSFAKAWIAENEQGRPHFADTRAKEQTQVLEQVGVKLRAMMPFLDPVTVRPDGASA